jgi:hypothetical protein
MQNNISVISYLEQGNGNVLIITWLIYRLQNIWNGSEHASCLFIIAIVAEPDPHQSDKLDPDPDPHQSDKLGPDPDPHQCDKLDPDPHKSDKLHPDPHQFADDKLKCMEYEPILGTFSRLSIFLEAKIWICIKVTCRSATLIITVLTVCGVFQLILVLFRNWSRNLPILNLPAFDALNKQVLLPKLNLDP